MFRPSARSGTRHRRAHLRASCLCRSRPARPRMRLEKLVRRHGPALTARKDSVQSACRAGLRRAPIHPFGIPAPLTIALTESGAIWTVSTKRSTPSRRTGTRRATSWRPRNRTHRSDPANHGPVVVDDGIEAVPIRRRPERLPQRPEKIQDFACLPGHQARSWPRGDVSGSAAPLPGRSLQGRGGRGRPKGKEHRQPEPGWRAQP